MTIPTRPRRLPALFISALASFATMAPALAGGPGAVTTDRVAIDGLDISYEVHGELSPGETPVLVLHGRMGSPSAPTSPNSCPLSPATTR